MCFRCADQHSRRGRRRLREEEGRATTFSGVAISLSMESALVREQSVGCISVSWSAYQRIRVEAGMPRPVIRLSTLSPIFAAIR